MRVNSKLVFSSRTRGAREAQVEDNPEEVQAIRQILTTIVLKQEAQTLIQKQEVYNSGEFPSDITEIVEQGGDPCQRGAMGSGAAHPRPGPDRPSNPHCRSPDSLGGDHLEMHQAAGHCPLPCDEEAGIRLSTAHPHDATRGETESPSGGRGVEAIAPITAISHLGSGRHLSTTRDDASQCLRTADYYPSQVRTFKLGNRGNFYYANATLKCIIYASAFKGGLGTVFNGGLLRFLRQILQQGGTAHLWSQRSNNGRLARATSPI